MKSNLLSLFILSVIFLLTSCSDDDNSSDNNSNDAGKYSKGIFFINEGTFGVGNGSISFYDGSTVEHQIFANTNTRPLGDVVQDLYFHDNKGYIVVNNSNKLEIVNQSDFTELATITGLKLPRYFIPSAPGKGYISTWGEDGVSGKIQILDLETEMITDSISTGGGGPEKMKIIGDKIYIGHSGGWGVDSVVTVIDPFNNNIIQTLEPGYNPGEIVQDALGNVWVLSYGKIDWVTNESVNGRLTAYNPQTFEMVKDFELPGTFPSSLVINENGNTLYFIFNGEIVSQNINDDILALNTVVSGSYYGLGFHDSKLYVGDAKDFVSEGTVYLYEENGMLSDSLAAGIAPNGFVFEN